MRIIAGKLKGKHFYPPKNIPARPTTDIAKEGLFNILTNYINFEDVDFLDLFAGTGNIGMEMFSRGCNKVTSVDLSSISIKFIQEMSKMANIPQHYIIKADAIQFIKQARNKYDLIFAGPPYPLECIDEIPNLVFEHQLLKENAWLILETSPRHNFSEHQNCFNLRKYGQTHFWFFKNIDTIPNEN